MQSALIRAIAHWLVDHLPFAAFGEVVSSLMDMHSFYGTPRAEDARRMLASAKVLKRLPPRVRDDLVFPDEE